MAIQEVKSFRRRLSGSEYDPLRKKTLRYRVATLQSVHNLLGQVNLKENWEIKSYTD